MDNLARAAVTASTLDHRPPFAAGIFRSMSASISGAGLGNILLASPNSHNSGGSATRNLAFSRVAMRADAQHFFARPRGHRLSLLFAVNSPVKAAEKHHII